jgi:hypothetical protein
MRDYVPDAGATERLTGDIDAAVVNLELAAEAVDNFQRQPVSVPKACKRLRRLRRIVVPSTAPIGLRDDDVTRVGLLVRRQLLCEDIPPPPASVLQKVAQNPIDSNDKARTTRQKYEQHKTQALCAACHQQFDVIGFGMEEMDGIGRVRSTENGLPIDSSGQLNGTDVDGAFNGVAELSTKLASSQMFTTCFVRQFFRFAESRPSQETDQCVIDSWSKSFTEGGGHVRDLIASYTTDPGFQARKEDRRRRLVRNSPVGICSRRLALRWRCRFF